MNTHMQQFDAHSKAERERMFPHEACGVRATETDHVFVYDHF